MKLVQIWRYPVKSMQGEQLVEIELTPRGVRGDRAFAVKTVNGRVVSAKNAKRFARLFECHAAGEGRAVRMRMPSGEYPIGECEEVLSSFLGEPVYISSDPPANAEIDYIDLDANPLTFPPMPGTFFDTAPMHVLFTDEIETLQSHVREANLDVRRFRPNLLVEGGPGTSGVLKVGDAMLEIEGPCPRCIMTTLPQPGGLPQDVEILKSVAREMGGSIGWLARVTTPGRIRVGDAVT